MNAPIISDIHTVYYARLDMPLPAQQFRQLLAKMPNNIQRKIKAFRRWQDAHACLLGKYLVLEAFYDLGLNVDLSRLEYSSFGRPSIRGMPDFNISHSGTFVLCAISIRGLIGIDIEKKLPIAIHDLRKHCSPSEWNKILSASAPEDTFYDCWTIKEAVLKADGQGLAPQLSDIDTSGGTKLHFNNQAWHILNINDFDQYACHIASNAYSNGYCLRQIVMKI